MFELGFCREWAGSGETLGLLSSSPRVLVLRKYTRNWNTNIGALLNLLWRDLLSVAGED